MPRINLLPWRDEERKERKLKFLVALGGAAVAACLVAFIGYLLMDSMVSAQEARNAKLSEEIAVLDKQIEKYRAQHHGSNPLYCIMSAEEADELADMLRQQDGQPDYVINTTYQDIKIIRNSLMDRGEYFLGNELPETGS